VAETCDRLRRVLTLCKVAGIRDLTPAGVQGALQTIRDDGAGLETLNGYLRSVKSFSRWLWREKRTPDDALAVLSKYNAETDRRHVRRELTPDEAVYLWGFVEGYTTPNHNLTGPDRAMVYMLALGTGFRASELRSLTPESFDLDADPPTVAINAAYSKRRRQDLQPIRRDLVELLRPWLAGRPARVPVFGKLPGGTARMLRKDLEAARQVWLAEATTDVERQRRNESDFLKYQDSAGRFADFHATRHTYISAIVAGGKASVKTCQELARHSTPVLTIGRYSHARLHDLMGALDALPDLKTKTPKTQPQAMKATGTDDIPPVGVESLCGSKCGSSTAAECDGTGKNAAEPGERNAACTTADAMEEDVPQVLTLADVGEKKPHAAACGSRRRARESNPQPLTGHHISNVAAHHSHTLRNSMILDVFRSRVLPSVALGN
jgi:integrase